MSVISINGTASQTITEESAKIKEIRSDVSRVATYSNDLQIMNLNPKYMKSFLQAAQHIDSARRIQNLYSDKYYVFFHGRALKWGLYS